MIFLRSKILAAIFVLGVSSPVAGQGAYTLDDLLDIGRERNPTLQALRAEQSAMEAHRRVSGRWDNPELEYEWGSGDPREGGGSRSVSGFSARQVLENPLTRHFRLGSVQALVDASAQDVRLGVLDVEFEVRMHFYRILFLEEMVGLARLNEEALSEIRALIETRARVGEVRELEAIRLRVEHLRARNEMEAAVMELDQFRRHLNTFLGNILPEDFALEGSLDAAGDIPELEEITKSLLPTHPAMVRAQKEREAAESAVREHRFGWLPDPVLSGASKKELDGEVRTFGIGLQIPLWNQSRAATQEANQRLRLEEYREEALRLELETNLMIHHNHLRLNQQTLRLFQDGLLGEAEQSMEIAETSYREGEISFMEYLDARRTFQSIQIQYQQALFDWNVELATLDQAAGGGIVQ